MEFSQSTIEHNRAVYRLSYYFQPKMNIFFTVKYKIFWKIFDDILKLEEEYKELIAKIDNLKEQGMINASPWWKQGKYLYLVHPMTNGHRKREYIGCDSFIIKEALAKIERWKELGRIQFIVDKLERKINKVEKILVYLQQELDPTFNGDKSFLPVMGSPPGLSPI